MKQLVSEKGKVRVCLYTDVLVISNPPATLEKEVLSGIIKTMEPDEKRPWTQVVKRKRHDFFEVVNDKPRIITTEQGFWLSVCQWLREADIPYVFEDARIEFPLLDLDRMHGFRFSQEDLLRTALMQKSSGLIEAPTRYGKCFARGTEVLYLSKSGEIRSTSIENITVGSSLVGEDGIPRIVKSCIRGDSSAMVDVYYTGEDGEEFLYTVTWDHLMVVRRKGCNSLEVLPVSDIIGNEVAFELWNLETGDHDFRLERCVSNDEYYGFEIEGDRKMFVLKGGHVVHNSVLILNTVRALYEATTVVTAPGKDLVKQTYDMISSKITDREVVMLGAGSRARFPSNDITVCSLDSLHKCNYLKTKALLIDEPHACVTNSRIDNVREFRQAIKLGYGATTTGRFDGKDKLIVGMIGPILAKRTFKEAVAEGAICQIDCVMIVLNPKNKNGYFDRNAAIRKLLYESSTVATLVNELSTQLVPKEWQTLFFIKNEKQADFMLPYIGNSGVIAMAKKMTDKQRDAMFALMATGEVNRCAASDIYAQGVTFSDLRCVVNLGGGGPYTNTVQKPGRLAEIRPGKVSGLMVDVMFSPEGSRPGTPYGMLVHDSQGRFKVYEEKGYNLHFVHNREELRVKIAEIVTKNTIS